MECKTKFPYVSWDEVMAFDAQRPETATRSVVLNAFLEAIPWVRPCDLKYIGIYLGLPSAALSGAIYCATGLSFAKFIDKWRLGKLRQIKEDDPKLKGDHLAHMLGFYDRSTLWLFMKRKGLLRRCPAFDQQAILHRIFEELNAEFEAQGMTETELRDDTNGL